MSNIEVLSSEIDYEAFLHHVRVPDGIIAAYCQTTDAAGIEAVRSMRFESRAAIETLAWVDLSKRAKITIRHDFDESVRNYDDKPYGFPNYPEETIFGKQLSYEEAWLVTDRNDLELEFTQESELLERGKLPPYTARWLGAVANGNNHPAFSRRLYPLLGRLGL